MGKFTDWLKVQIKNPKFYIKLFAVILTFGILLMPKNTTFQSAESDSSETTAETEQQSDTPEDPENKENTEKKQEFHIGTTNIIGLAGGIIALAVVKYKEHNFINKRK